MYAIYVNVSLTVKVEYIKQSEYPCLSLSTAYFILNGTTILLKHQDRNLGFPLNSSFPNPLHMAVPHSTYLSFLCSNIWRIFSVFPILAITILDYINYFFTWTSTIVCFLYTSSFLLWFSLCWFGIFVLNLFTVKLDILSCIPNGYKNYTSISSSEKCERLRKLNLVEFLPDICCNILIEYFRFILTS